MTGCLAHFRRVVSFHPRGGRLNAVQRKAFETHADEWYLEAAELDGPLDPAALFDRHAGLVLEIGSGMGESTVAMAVARPEINLLAVEVYKPGVAQTLHHLNRAGVDNVRVMRGDGVQVLTELVAPGTLAEVWLFFPDPWPKTQPLQAAPGHPRVRGPGRLQVVPRRRFRLATDWAPYAERMLAACTATKGLRNVHAGWAPRPEFRPRTRFERRGLAAGHEIFDLEFTRR